MEKYNKLTKEEKRSVDSMIAEMIDESVLHCGLGILTGNLVFDDEAKKVMETIASWVISSRNEL